MVILKLRRINNKFSDLMGRQDGSVIKAFAIKLDDLNLTPGTHMIEGENFHL